MAMVTPSDPTSPTLHFEAKAHSVLLNGAPFHFKGASYFGMETPILVPHGLWGGSESTTLSAVATLLAENRFNAARIPLAVDAVLANPAVDTTVIANETELLHAFRVKPPLRYLDVLDHFIKVLADHKLVALLDAHVLNHASGGITELWYTSDENKNDFQRAWMLMAERYKRSWNVIGADLQNEPHGVASWGSSDGDTDFRLAALQWGSAILEIAPHWLIFVEGIQCSSRDDPASPAFWGENLMDVQRAPLRLPVEHRLVYSPHVYGPDVDATQPYFADPARFPELLPPIWDLHFGFLARSDAVDAPLVVGEWGGSYRNDADRAWQNVFAEFLETRGIGSFVWCVNPNSSDTEGLLENDWTTPRADKLALLSIFHGTPIP